jgi:toxin HigB-1
MIASFRSKALKRFWEKSDGRLLNPKHLVKIQLILDALELVSTIEDFVAIGSDMHKLTGFAPPRWSVHVNGNWCVTFSFEDGEVFAVDYEDYH